MTKPQDAILDRRVPTDDVHIQKYPLMMSDVPSTPTPVIMGTNWYESFDKPEKINGKWWIGRGELGRVRGGHAYCLKPSSLVDSRAWWSFYDQGEEGACVGFGASRAMSLLNRVRYDAPWLYHEAQLVDEWPETPPEGGTSVRAAMDILRTRGHKTPKGLTPERKHGILVNRWARTVDEVIACLASPKLYDIGGVPILNSWGKDYQHIVYLPLDVLQRLLNEQGEATIITGD